MALSELVAGIIVILSYWDRLHLTGVGDSPPPAPKQQIDTFDAKTAVVLCFDGYL